MMPHAALTEEFAKPLHSRPLVQCVCGLVLRDALCHTFGCTGNHTPEAVWQMCGVCKGAQADLR